MVLISKARHPHILSVRNQLSQAFWELRRHATSNVQKGTGYDEPYHKIKVPTIPTDTILSVLEGNEAREISLPHTGRYWSGLGGTRKNLRLAAEHNEGEKEGSSPEGLKTNATQFSTSGTLVRRVQWCIHLARLHNLMKSETGKVWVL